MPRLKLTLAYVGTNYCGWQVQARKTEAPLPTIQAEVIKAVSRVCRIQTHVQGSGRTDSGVHAEGQVAHCDIPEHLAGINWQRALHSSLPTDIRVRSFELVADDFDACSSAKGKAYRYGLWLDSEYTSPRLYPFVWSCGPLDFKAIEQAIPYLVGEHDFSCVQNAGTDIKSAVRNLFNIEILSDPSWSGPELKILRFSANGFLKQMVRNLVGLLVACGRGKFLPEDIPELIASQDRRKAPQTAPAKGLCLEQVWY